MFNSTPLFIQAVTGVSLIGAFDAQLIRYGISPTFKHQVLRFEQDNGKNVLDAYYGFDKRYQLDVNFIEYLMQSIIDEYEPVDKKRKRGEVESNR